MSCCPQVNLKLFAPEPNRRKTVLLFVIRDKSKTPQARLEQILGEDVHKMWDSISKPPQYVDSRIDDFFEVGRLSFTAHASCYTAYASCYTAVRAVV